MSSPQIQSDKAQKLNDLVSEVNSSGAIQLNSTIFQFGLSLGYVQLATDLTQLDQSQVPYKMSLIGFAVGSGADLYAIAHHDDPVVVLNATLFLTFNKMQLGEIKVTITTDFGGATAKAHIAFTPTGAPTQDSYWEIANWASQQPA